MQNHNDTEKAAICVCQFKIEELRKAALAYEHAQKEALDMLLPQGKKNRNISTKQWIKLKDSFSNIKIDKLEINENV